MVVASSATCRRGRYLTYDDMWYVYAIQSLACGHVYIGYTQDLRRRFAEHNQGRGGTYTKNHRPFKLIFYEAYVEKRDAEAAEKFFKTGYGREVLKGKLKHYLNTYRRVV